MRTPLSLLLALAMGCQPTIDDGTSVGNPSPTKVETASNARVSYDVASVHVSRVVATDCSGVPVARTVDATFNTVHDALVLVPGGTWCALDLELGSPVLISGRSDVGAVDIELDVPVVSLSEFAGFTVDGESRVFELGHPGWIDPFVPATAGDLVVTPADFQHAALATLMERASALFIDADGDLELSGAERGAGSDAAGDLREDDDDEEDAGEDSWWDESDD
jgi:hypothetical protein